MQLVSGTCLEQAASFSSLSLAELGKAAKH